ncbi:hypothetical protein [Streptomyces hainanensis]|nr:hypothetical protein [Streptomyces hainanensis]
MIEGVLRHWTDVEIDRQRAKPPAGGRLAIDPDRRTQVPYPVETGHA